MSKKGFTIVEVLAVLILLGVLATIFIPNTIKLIKNNSMKIYQVKEKELITATKTYIDFDKDFVDIPSGESTTISIDVLKDKEYISDILDSNSKNVCYAFSRVSNTGASYVIEPCIICDEYKTSYSFCVKS